MESELSVGAMVGVLFSLLMVIAIMLFVGGFVVSNTELTVMNATLLKVTLVLIPVFISLAARMSYLNASYFDLRFKVVDTIKSTEIRYIDVIRLSVLSLFHFIFKPVRFKKVETLEYTNKTNYTLTGELKVEGNRFLLNQIYLSLNPDLFEYIGESVRLDIVVPSARQKIAGDISMYQIAGVTKVA